jgi:hypothetical protein
MADKQVSELTDIDALADADSFPVRDASATSELREVTASQVATYMAAELGATFDAAGAAATAQAAAVQRANHTGTQLASTISDFATAVAATAAVTANTAKVTNATHTGEVTGATALTIAADAVTNAKAANMAASTIKGRVTASTGDPEDLTPAQARTVIASDSGGGTSNFLRADGTWAAPAGGGGGGANFGGAGLRTAGVIAETIPRWAGIGNVSILTAGRVLLTDIWLPAQQITSISYLSATTAGSGMTNQWFAITNAAGIIQAVTGDDGSTAWGSSTAKTLTLTSPWTPPSAGTYRLAIVVAGTTPPTLRAVASPTAVPAYSALGPTGQTTPRSVSDDISGEVFPGGSPYAWVS